MSGASLSVTFDDGGILAVLDGLALAGTRPRELLRAIGAGLADSARRRFSTQSGPDGTGWPGLSPAYAEIRARPGSPILVQTGALRESLTFMTRGHEVVVGSAMIYAGVHQFGAIIEAKNAPALAFHLGDGRGGARLVRVRKVKIPARPFLGISPEDGVMIIETAADYVRRLLDAA